MALTATRPEQNRLARNFTSGRSRSQELLDAAWSFPGRSKSKASGANVTGFVLAALTLHGALALTPKSSPVALGTSTPQSLEMLVPIETIETPEAPIAAPLDVPEPSPTERSSAARDPAERFHVSTASNLSPEQSAQPGPLPEDAAAELLASDFNDGDFSLPSGNGLSLGRGSTARTGGGGFSLGLSSRSSNLAARDLSRPAIAPDLLPLINSNFPAAARLARVEGSVTVSAMIQEDGNPTDVRVVQVDPRGRGFGETCTRTLHQGPDWKPKLNRDGRPVATRVEYTCRFRLPEAALGDVEAPATGVGANRVWSKPAGG